MNSLHVIMAVLLCTAAAAAQPFQTDKFKTESGILPQWAAKVNNFGEAAGRKMRPGDSCRYRASATARGNRS